QWLVRSRTTPQIVVAGLRGRLRTVHLADAAAALVAQAASQLHLADAAGVEERHRVPHTGVGATLRAALADLVVLPRRLDDLPALEHIVTDRLLDVDVLAVLDRSDGHEAVPVVRRGDGDDIDVLVRDDLADVLFVAGRRFLDVLDRLHGLAD